MTIKKNKLIASLQRSSADKGNFILLESQMQYHPASKKTYVALGTVVSIRAYGDQVFIFEDEKENVISCDPWEALKEFRQKHKEWCFGFLGYDLKNYTEKLSSENLSLIDTPDLLFFVPELLVEIDEYDEVTVLKGELPKDLTKTVIESDIKIKQVNQISQKEYQRKIISAQKQIHEGEFYEINLSHPIEFEYIGTGWDLYQKMKSIGPVPFGSYIKFDNIEVSSASPERFLSRKGNIICSQPIKGTVSRSSDDDISRIEALSNSEKERAENLMIVDLVRNDLSRVSEKGSVKVSNLFEIQSFETVHQMVSTIEAVAKEGIESVDILSTCFPMGSMTGAPKVAAMKAIEKIEDYKRGIYSGAIGYFTPEGDFDFNVVIRTAVMNSEKMIYSVGGAITSDSIPEQEWEETLLKAKAITNLIN